MPQQIAVIEANYEETRFLEKELLKGLKGYQVSFFWNIGDFLEALVNYTPSVLVLEIVLPLISVSSKKEEENATERVRVLRERFSWLGEDWNGVKGGEVLVRGIRSTHPDLPIVINTDIDLGYISGDIQQMQRLEICAKGFSARKLISAIRSFKTT